ncbi:MAG: ribonuclease Z [Candidatus Hodarchaeota archaeon]
MKVYFLGVGGGIPSLERTLPAVAIYLKRRILLFDCGEGTQLQLQRAKLSPQRITQIFISHLHGDHVLGLPGLVSTMAMQKRAKPLSVFGPTGISKFIENSLELTQAQIEFKLTVREVGNGIITEQEEYTVECLPAVHSVPALSFILRMADTPGRFYPTKANHLGVPPGTLRKDLQQGRAVITPEGRRVTPKEVVGPSRKGLIVVYTGDTAPNSKLASSVNKVDLLIHDATFIEMHKERATEFLHSTALQAAQIALQLQAKQLALVHISPRYASPELHLQEAQSVFPRTFAPKDLEVHQFSK